jgi:hypothetical protein
MIARHDAEREYTHIINECIGAYVVVANQLFEGKSGRILHIGGSTAGACPSPFSHS